MVVRSIIADRGLLAKFKAFLWRFGGFDDFNLKTTKARWVADEVRDEIAMVPMECHILVIFNGRREHLTMISARVTWNISACYHDT